MLSVEKTRETSGISLKLLLAALTFMVLVPFFLLSPFSGAFDATFHLCFAEDFSRCLSEGDGVPDWNAVGFEGKGSPAFRYWAPLVYLISALFLKAGFPVNVSLKLVVFLFVFFGALGVRRLLRTLSLESQENLGTVLFLTFPLIHIHLYGLFLFQNLCAVMFFPWTLAFWLEKHQSLEGRIKAILGFSCMGLMHLPTLLICGYAHVFLAIGEAITAKNPRRMFLLLALFIASMGIIAPYVLPALGTIQEVQFSRLIEVSPWANNYFLDDVEMPIPSGGGAPGPFLVFRLFFLATTLLLGFLGAYGIFSSSRAPGEGIQGIRLSAIAGLILLLFNFRLSTVLWKTLPGLKVVLYPWRFIFPACILLLPVITRIFERSDGSFFAKGSFMKFLSLVAVVFLLGLSVFSMTLAQPTPSLEEMRKVPFIPFEYLPAACHALSLPKQKAPLRGLSVLSGTGRILQETHRFQRSEWMIQVDSPSASMQIETHWDPYWRISLDGIDWNLTPAGDCGEISLDVPAGTHQAILYRVPPAYRNLGWILAFLTLAALLVLIRKDRKGSGPVVIPS